MQAATLYTRAGCHLCDEAAEVLVAHGLRVRKVDIDRFPDLQTKYSTKVPVVEINGRVRFWGVINPRLLRRIIAAEFTE